MSLEGDCVEILGHGVCMHVVSGIGYSINKSDLIDIEKNYQ